MSAQNAEAVIDDIVLEANEKESKPISLQTISQAEEALVSRAPSQIVGNSALIVSAKRSWISSVLSNIGNAALAISLLVVVLKGPVVLIKMPDGKFVDPRKTPTEAGIHSATPQEAQPDEGTYKEFAREFADLVMNRHWRTIDANRVRALNMMDPGLANASKDELSVIAQEVKDEFQESKLEIRTIDIVDDDPEKLVVLAHRTVRRDKNGKHQESDPDLTGIFRFEITVFPDKRGHIVGGKMLGLKVVEYKETKVE